MSCIPNRTSPISEKRIGANGGKYQARFKNADGSWSPWWNLGGGLNASDVEVKLVEAAEPPVGPMWNALLNYVLENQSEDPMALLRLWREGSFDVIRKEWPDVPKEIYPAA